MFESFFQGQGNHAKAERDSEKRQIDANREFTAINASAAEYQAEREEQERKVDLIKWQQEFDPSRLKHALRNEQYIEEDGIWIKKQEFDGNEWIDMPALMTEEGISATENAISSFIGDNAKNLINTSLDEKQIVNILVYSCKDLVHIFQYNYDRYFVRPTPSNMTLALRIIKNEIKATPFRALNGFTKRQDNTAIKRVETFADSSHQNEKRNMFGLR